MLGTAAHLPDGAVLSFLNYSVELYITNKANLGTG